MGAPASDVPEMMGLAQVVAQSPRDAPTYILSEKASFGHCGVASGLIAMIVTTLALQHQSIPPVLNVTTPMKLIRENRHLRLQVGCPHYLQPQLTEAPAYASISGTSITGDNAHLVLQHGGWDDAPTTVSIPSIQPAHFRSSNSRLYTWPPIKALQAMTTAELVAVSDFLITRPGFGTVRWDINPLNLATTELGSLVHQVSIERGEVDVQHLELRRHWCTVTLEGLFPKHNGTHTEVAYGAELQAKVELAGHIFVNYDPNTSVLRFVAAPHTKLGAPDVALGMHRT
jgi:hypothetical protein